MSLIEKINGVNPVEVADACAQMLHVLQDHRPEVQVASLLTMSGQLYNVLGVDIRSELERLERLVADAENNGFTKKFAAVAAYIEGELKACVK